MMHRIVLLLLALLTLTSCATHRTRSDADMFATRTVTVDGQPRAYRVFVPRDLRRGVKTPIVLFLHGSGERGTDNQRQTESGLGPHLRRHPDFPAIVVFPQSLDDENWSGATARYALAALDAATQEFGGDPERTSLTGMSRGGYGVWELALLQPTRFAALAPVCGGIEHMPPPDDDIFIASLLEAPDPYAVVSKTLHDTPIWIFHGARDDIVPPDYSRRLVAALRHAGGDARYTEFPDANHNSWDAAYASEELWRWMFEQRRVQGL